MGDVAAYRGLMPLEVTALPARVVYLVRAGSREGFRRAVQEASTRWGGVTEPIIEVGEGGVIDENLKHLVRRACVDGSVNVDLPAADAEAAAVALDLEVVAIAHIDERGPGRFTCNPGWVGEWQPPVASNVIASRDGQLWEAVAGGDVTAKYEEKQDYSCAPIRRSRTQDDVGRAQLESGTLLDRTAESFHETYGSQAVQNLPMVLWVVAGDSLEDCWDYWNFRALRPLYFGSVPMIILPYEDYPHWIGFADQLAGKLRRPEGFAPDVILTSRSLTDDQLRGIARSLELSETDEEVRRGPFNAGDLRDAPFTYRIERDPEQWVAFERIYGVSVQTDIHVFAGQTRVRFPSPVEFRAGRTLLRFGGLPFAGLPRRSCLADFIQPGASWKYEKLEIQTHASDAYTLNFSIPTLDEALSAVLNATTIRNALSDKGQLGESLRRGIDLNRLRQPQLLEVIDRITTKRTEHFIKQVEKSPIDPENKAALLELAEQWGGRLTRRYARAQDVTGGATEVTVAAMETLAELGWAERGLEIRCAVCKLKNFIPLGRLQGSGAAICPGCGSHEKYSSNKFGPTIHYQLDSLVDRGSDLGVVPHLLTIAELARRDEFTSLLPGVDVWVPDIDGKKEVDIYGVHAGRIIAGEVKTSGTGFTDEELEKDVKVCRALQVDTFVMSATDNIPHEARAKAERLCEGAGIGLIVLEERDLRDLP